MRTTLSVHDVTRVRRQCALPLTADASQIAVFHTKAYIASSLPQCLKQSHDVKRVSILAPNAFRRTYCKSRVCEFHTNQRLKNHSRMPGIKKIWLSGSRKHTNRPHYISTDYTRDQTGPGQSKKRQMGVNASRSYHNQSNRTRPDRTQPNNLSIHRLTWQSRQDESVKTRPDETGLN